MTAPAAPAAAPTGRLGNGQLRRQVAEYLADHPGPCKPGEIAKALGKSAGAVGNALTTLAGRGEADLASPASPAATRPTPPPPPQPTAIPPRAPRPAARQAGRPRTDPARPRLAGRPSPVTRPRRQARPGHPPRADRSTSRGPSPTCPT